MRGSETSRAPLLWDGSGSVWAYVDVGGMQEYRYECMEVEKWVPGIISHKSGKNQAGPSFALLILIPPGWDLIWHPAPTHKVQI